MDSILIVDDEEILRKLLGRMLGLEGYEVLQAGDCRSAIKLLETHKPDVVLCDVFLPDGNGVDLISKIKSLVCTCEIILLTAHGNIPDGVQAIKNGAFDYIIKGDDNNKIIPLISRAMEKAKNNIGIKGKNINLSDSYSFDKLKSLSPIMNKIIAVAKKASITDVTILLTGETGTGKEVFANAIHNASNRSAKNFVAINCSAFSKDLLESELFGYKAGAFTGAIKDKKGLFEEANHGTIFLDEIGEMAFELQAKLLRVLENNEFIKIGDTKPTKIDIRIIAATNRNLKKEIENNRFREDLFYRLSVFNINIPPLRERREDIKPLTDLFISYFSKRLKKDIISISNDYYEALEHSQWEGNIRELRNVIERSMIIADERLCSDDLPLDFQCSDNMAGKSEFDLAGMEKTHITKVLKYTNGNKTEASRLLKIGLTTLYRKIEEYRIEL
ncbi:MAG: sigma-54 dependent transcriptional regulator [Muribaculaceae bacterium]|nr:sigma-54 dependent transcriptional regulator [Muribaculaceae bacterium]